MHKSLLGIDGGDSKTVSIVQPFSGEEPEKFSRFINQLKTALTAKGIPLPGAGSSWLETEQVKFAKKEAELNPIVQLTAIQEAQNYVIGDLALTPTNRQAYEKELELNLLKKSHAIALLNQFIVPSSEAFNVITEGFVLSNFEKMYWDLMDKYRGARLSVLIVHVERYVEILTTGTLRLAELVITSTECKRAFCEILGLSNTSDNVDTKNAKKVKIMDLWTTLVEVVSFSKISTEKINIRDFIQRYVRENTVKPLEIDLALFLTQLKTFCDSSKHSPPTPKTDENKVVPVAKAYYTKLVNESKAYNALKRKPEDDQNGKGKTPKTGGNPPPKCTFCGKLKHTAENCFVNPNANQKAREIGEKLMKKKKEKDSPNVSVNTVNVMMTTTDHNADTELQDMLSGKHLNILLDGGSNSNIFNKYSLHLFHNLQKFSCEIDGIGGTIDKKVTHIGEIVFMGKVMPAYYSPNLPKSIISEPKLCSLFNFQISKVSNHCEILNLSNNVTTTIYLDKECDQYILPIELFQHDKIYNEINLASVRPANQKTLWHARFGHAYMGLIVKMARQDIYKNRGLRLPENLTKHDHEEDLCEVCALGKPTFSYKYTPQYRSEIKGKLWYFDVSGGGDLTPSLVHGNIYVYMFVDSHTRMYFKYFTKNCDGKTTLDILQRFNKDVLSSIPDREDIIFIQCDNGQIDDKNVVAYLRRNGAYIRYTHPYHPNMNGFVERAFRSVKDLARCMMTHAGLPDNYWEKAISYACLIRNIMPNATMHGYTREAYFKWYGLMFDYSRLRTWGSRAYALHHITYKDFRTKSTPGIFVGMAQDDIQYQYELFLPNAGAGTFITSGDVIFCEHVTRGEPERLLPPISMVPKDLAPTNIEDYQYLVDTVHVDDDDGLLYIVDKVYDHKGLIVVDRYSFDGNQGVGRPDTVHLLNILKCPIVQGRTNSEVQKPVAMLPEPTPSNVGSSSSFCVDPLTSDKRLREPETDRQKTKRLRGEAQSLSHRQNVEKDLRRSLRNKVKINTSNTHLRVDDYNTRISKLILDWAVEYIPDDCWEPVSYPISSNYTDINTSVEINTSNIEVSHPYTNEPRHHAEAMSRHSEKSEWITSEKRELDALFEMNFATVCDIPLDRKPLQVIWVYKYKRDANNNIILYKSRLVVRGDKAIKGYDYFETFSPVAKIDSIRLVLAMIIIFKLIPLQLDVNNAYVQSDLNEDVYIKAIPGGENLPEGKCYKLNKSLYGLPQSGRNWNSAVSKFLIEYGFVQLREDLCVYVLFENNMLVAVITLYVDDFLLGCQSAKHQELFTTKMCNTFKTKIIGLPSTIVGLRLQWEAIPNQLYFKKVHISNPKSVKVLLDKFKITGSRVVATPYNAALPLSRDQCPRGVQMNNPELLQMQDNYRTLVGTFIWLQTTTRIDILQTVLVLSQFVANPAWEHYKAAIRLLRYLQGTIDLGIEYSIESDPMLVGYADADHASHECRRSIYSYIFMMAGGPIAWKNGFEDRFSLSTAESEIRAVYALREALKHLLYLKKIFKSFLKENLCDDTYLAMSELPIKIMEDNSATINYQINPSSKSSMKYLEVDIYWIHDSYMRNEFKLFKIESTRQLADLNTKFNTAEIFFNLRGKLMKIFVTIK